MEKTNNKQKEIKQETIDKYIWDYVRDVYASDIKEYKKHIEEFSFKINLKQEIVEIILQGYDTSNFYKEILNGTQEQEIDNNEKVCRFGEDVKELDDTDLIMFVDKEEEMFFDSDYIDTDWIIEDIMYFFVWDKKQYGKYTNYCSSYQGSLHLKLNYFEGINSFKPEYRNKADIEEHLEWNLDFVEVMNIILAEHFKGYGIDYKEERKDIERVSEIVKEELKERLIEYGKQYELAFSQYDKIDNLKDKYIRNLIDSDVNSIHRKMEDIKEVLK